MAVEDGRPPRPDFEKVFDTVATSARQEAILQLAASLAGINNILISERDKNTESGEPFLWPEERAKIPEATAVVDAISKSIRNSVASTNSANRRRSSVRRA